MKRIILAALILLPACQYLEPVYLQHLDTGQIVHCGPYDGPAMEAAAIAMRELACINDYKEQGFVRVPKPGN